MKLERLLTLSQFVDECENSEVVYIFGYGIDCDKFRYSDIVKYNNFIKQPLTKDMFVNIYNSPNESLKKLGGFTDFELYQKQRLRFEEAEKKVIFELDGKIENGSNGIWYCGDFIYFNTPLHKVAEITKGKLKLKNVEL